MEILIPNPRRRSTRLRVQIPVTVTSMDRRHPFVEECIALVINPQGCGFQASEALPLETPVQLSGLSAAGTYSAKVASCLPLGQDGKYFLIGVSLYNPGNVWGVPNPPEDWNCATTAVAASAGASAVLKGRNDVWPYNKFSGKGESHTGRK